MDQIAWENRNTRAEQRELTKYCGVVRNHCVRRTHFHRTVGIRECEIGSAEFVRQTQALVFGQMAGESRFAAPLNVGRRSTDRHTPCCQAASHDARSTHLPSNDDADVEAFGDEVHLLID